MCYLLARPPHPSPASHTHLPILLVHLVSPGPSPSQDPPPYLLQLPSQPASSRYHPHSESHRSPCREGRQRPGSPPGPSRPPHPPRWGHRPPPPRPVPAAPAPGTLAGRWRGAVPGGAVANPRSQVAGAPGLQVCGTLRSLQASGPSLRARRPPPPGSRPAYTGKPDPPSRLWFPENS